ncbi:M3 family oligoendopeptidase [Acidimicrobiia bacterium EGI L10123]|uniref:M3 family oligoendopeptidase n=1 Tax=Salinilacustrithrix flava TaxID=2957203 RepID=UPI003D7C1722|nr:M3 family oligoendopeptidase [Acidimicrobiia bacterium EGI L10123]
MSTDTHAPEATGAEGVAWDIGTLVDGEGAAGVRRLLDEALQSARTLTAEVKGTLVDADAPTLAAALDRLAEIYEQARRAGSFASLDFAVDTSDPARGALMQEVSERSAALSAELVWFDLEVVDIDDDRATALLDEPALAGYRHHLENLRAGKPHVLSEVEERLLATTAPTGRQAWVRLFTEQTSAIQVDLPDEPEPVPLDAGLSRLLDPDRTTRKAAAEAVTEALQPGLRTRAYVFNTLLADRRIQDELRGYPSWISSWNLDNEASDESVQALVDAVVARYDIPQRWYRLKARVLGIDTLADYDRNASVASTKATIGWSRATEIVRDAYASFSPELAEVVGRFIDEGWIDAPTRPGKRGGAFCSYTVPGHHPYVFLNYTATPGDVMTLAHELGHGLHGYLARPQGVFEQMTPLTLAETASVFGETVTFERLLSMVDDADERFALLAQNLEGNIATVFRQVSMNRFEDAVHTHRREHGELSTEDFADHWARTQGDLFGDAMEVTDGYRSWWSYVPHFIGTPGYVYAYAYGQLLALSVYARYVERGDEFVPKYLELLAAGGSRWPEDLGRIVDCNLTDPGFWDAGLAIIDTKLTEAEQAAADAGRI